MKTSADLVFKPDGTCVGLSTEIIDLALLGHLCVRRAFTVEFDNEKQAWRVKDKRGFPLFTSPSRQECIDWERQYFDNRIERGHS